MSTFTPSTPIQLQIRKIIFEKYNDVDKKFTNDEIFETIKLEGDFNSSWIIDDLEPYILEICNSGLTRNIAQNFTTIWLKLFDTLKKFHCNSCNHDIYLGDSEKQQCPNPSCSALI
ncbi:MAG: hypothetical protein OEL77_05665 [Nitrosopumilus sp.]|nr:hypothetical protein [Nitrosopumilus sp.]MDH3385482.1 hypothetical protein [Nitrosopumilus sp.]